MLWELFITFLKIGAFTFGSGYAMIPLIEREVIDKKKWFDREDFKNQFTLAQSAPGPFSLNTAVFVGYKLHGWCGAVVSVVALVIPSFVILLLIAVYLSDFRDNQYVAAAFKGMRPAVIALIAVPFVNYLREMKSWWRIALAILAAFVIWYFGISPVYFIIGGAVVGIIAAFVKR
jgi:chromate transporter